MKFYLLWDALGNADGEGNFGFDCVHDGGSGEGWWDVDDGGVGIGGLLGLGDGVENGQVQLGVLLASLLWRHTTNDLCSISNGLFRVESSLFASETLNNNLNHN